MRDATPPLAHLLTADELPPGETGLRCGNEPCVTPIPAGDSYYELPIGMTDDKMVLVAVCRNCFIFETEG